MSAALDAIVREVCAAWRFDEGDEALVRSMLTRPPSSWPVCCGSGCKPCADDYEAAALEIQARLKANDAPATAAPPAVDDDSTLP